MNIFSSISWLHCKYHLKSQYIQCDVTRCIICIYNKTEYLDKEYNYQFGTKQLDFEFNYLSNAIKKILDKISFHKHFKMCTTLACRHNNECFAIYALERLISHLKEFKLFKLF